MTPLQNTGLYDPAFEHDSCGFGLIANIDGKASGWLVDQAFSALARMSHRGGVNSDGITGDGCGVLIYRADAWLRALANEASIELGPRFAAGMVFLDRDAGKADAAAQQLETCLREEGVQPAGWRDVPVTDEPCGPLGRATRPRIRQIFVNAANEMDEAVFDRALFRARRRCELALADDATFYVVSLAAATIGYKAMAAPGRLRDVFPDLQRTELMSAAVTFHQRFSTNTSPNWKLAQPFRLLAHNGEINTIRANRNWALARQPKLYSPLLDISDIGDHVSRTGSDSQSLDNMFELLVEGGIDLLAASRILVPPAWSADENLDQDLEAFYQYYALHTEPWDGPAGLVMCDARHAVCALDRNGLRPARWSQSDDGHLIVASEAGLWDVPEQRIIEAPAVVVDNPQALNRLHAANALPRDFVAVVRFQGPRANGMPEMHSLTPLLGMMQNQGRRVALVTDGRLSGASGKIPAAIHVTPEAAARGPLARLRDGDVIRIDGEAGVLDVLVDADAFAARRPDRDTTPPAQDLGRNLFAFNRAMASPADQGALSISCGPLLPERHGEQDLDTEYALGNSREAAEAPHEAGDA